MKGSFDRQKLTDSFRTRAFRAGGYSVLAAAMVIAIAVLVNLMAAKLPKQDLSAQSLFTLSAESEAVCAEVQEDVTVYWLVSPSNQDSYLEQLLEQYERCTPALRVEQIDPVVYPTFASNYTEETVTMNSLLFVSDKRSCYVSYESLYQYRYGSDGTTAVQFAGERELTRALYHVTADTLSRVYALTGHGELTLSSTFSTGLRSLDLETTVLDLLTVSAVPADADCILINAPETDLTDTERDLLLDYLAGGGSILLVTDCEVGADFVNLNAVTAAMGVTAEKGILVEGDGDRCLSGYPYYLLPDLGDHPITQPLVDGGYRVIAPFAGSLTIAETLPENVTVTALLTTSPEAFAKGEGILASTVEREDGDRSGPFTLAAAAEDAATGAQLVWLDSAMIADEETNAIASGGNGDFFLNAAAWMCGQDSGITIHAKDLNDQVLTVPAGDAARLTVVLCFLIPGAIVAVGAVVVIRRRRR